MANATRLAARMPALFLGHGNPMNALEKNPWTEAWRRLGNELPRPRAILSISAHWFVDGPRVTANERPATIHDFGGFPRELYEMKYPAPGSLELARRVRALLSPPQVELDETWGLDHGTWSLLVHVFPKADVPVVQLSLDATLAGLQHLALARQLRPLRDEGVLILGSGDVVHNLHAYAWGRKSVAPYEWATRFEARVRELVEARDFAALADHDLLGPDAALAVPTPDHYLPLLYVLAQHVDDDPITCPVEGFDGGSVSMLAVQVGGSRWNSSGSC